jgi:hypothetical protein
MYLIGRKRRVEGTEVGNGGRCSRRVLFLHMDVTARCCCRFKSS